MRFCRIHIFVTALLLLLLQSCRVEVSSPVRGALARFVVSGNVATVIDDKQLLLDGLSVYMHIDNCICAQAITYKGGKYVLEAVVKDVTLPMEIGISVIDADGDKNGAYESSTKFINCTLYSDFEGGDGSDFLGVAEYNLDFLLTARK